MFEKIYNKFYSLTRVLVWEINLKDDDSILLMNLNFVSQNKVDNLQLIKSFKYGFVYNIDLQNKPLIKKLSLKYASVILISGQGILHDEIQADKISELDILEHLSGGINTNDFIGLGLRQNDLIWNSFIVRKQSIKLIEEKFSISYLVSVYFKNQMNRDLIEEFNDSITSAGFQFLNYFHDEIAIGNSQIKANAIEVISKEKFIKLLKFATLLFVIFFITNEIIVQKLTDRYAQVEQATQMDQGKRKQLKVLEAKVKQQKDLIDATGANSIYPYSWVVDRIFHSLPKEIKLKSIEVNPLKLNLSKNEININANIVNIIGFTPTSVELDNWTKDLKSKDFIKSVLIVSFMKGLMGENNQFNLIIEII